MGLPSLPTQCTQQSLSSVSESRRYVSPLDFLGDDLTYFFSDREVYDLLGMICGYWADVGGISHWSMPEPTKKQEIPPGQTLGTMRLDAWVERERQLRGAPEAVSPGDIWNKVVVSPATFDSILSARLLTASVEASLKSYVDGLLGPDPFTYRESLNAYWWFMGVPWPLAPDGLVLNIPNDHPFFFEKEENVLSTMEALGLSLEDFVEVRPCSDRVRYGPVADIDLEYLRIASFCEVSQCLGLDPFEIRQSLHYSLPTKPQPTSPRR